MTWHLNHPVHGNKPRPVQAEAMRRAKGHAKFGQWLEQGLGKTALDLNEFIESDDTDINVVICPNSFKGDWAMAPAEWGVPWVPSGYWPKFKLPEDQQYYLYAINYEAVREKETLKQLIRLFERRRCKLTIDESTAIKTPGTATFKAVLELAKRAKMVRELNGTPLTQDVRDYYGQLRALGQLNGMEAVVFRNRFCEMGGYFDKQVVGTRNEEELARILNSCTFRALKKDWRKDLPPKQYVPVHLEMSKKQVQHYVTMMEEFYVMLEDEREVSADLVLTQMGKLRQISSCVLLDKGEHFFFEEPKNNSKLKATLDLIATSPGKVIVSYFYKPCGEMLFQALSGAKLKPAMIKGGMSPERMLAEKNRFNGDSDTRVIIGQQGAMARGHTLIGGKGRDRCTTMVFFENDFSSYWRQQMEDRNYGRDEKSIGTVVYDLIVSPMDQLTVDTLVRKKNLADRMDDIVAAVRGRR